MEGDDFFALKEAMELWGAQRDCAQKIMRQLKEALKVMSSDECGPFKSSTAKKNFEKRFISINCHMHELFLSGDHSLDVCTFGAAAWHFSSGSSSSGASSRSSQSSVSQGPSSRRKSTTMARNNRSSGLAKGHGRLTDGLALDAKKQIRKRVTMPMVEEKMIDIAADHRQSACFSQSHAASPGELLRCGATFW